MGCRHGHPRAGCRGTCGASCGTFLRWQSARTGVPVKHFAFGVARAPTNQHRPEAEHGPIRKQAGCTCEISTEPPRCAEANHHACTPGSAFLPSHQARTEQVNRSPCWSFYPLHIFVTAPGYPEAQANAAVLRTIRVRGPEPHRVPLASLVPELWSLCTSSCLSARPKASALFPRWVLVGEDSPGSCQHLRGKQAETPPLLPNSRPPSQSPRVPSPWVLLEPRARKTGDSFFFPCSPRF